MWPMICISCSKLRCGVLRSRGGRRRRLGVGVRTSSSAAALELSAAESGSSVGS